MKTKTIRPTPEGIWPTLPNGIHDISLSNSTRFDVVLYRQPHGLGLGIVGRCCYVFNAITAHTDYVAEKLGLGHYLGDAAIMADLINDQFGTPGTSKREGGYDPRCCAEPETVTELLTVTGRPAGDEFDITVRTNTGRELILRRYHQLNTPQLHHMQDYFLQFPASFVPVEDESPILEPVVDETKPQADLIVAITSQQYWGKGKNVEEALAQCRKAGARGVQNVLLYAYTGTEQELKGVSVNGMGDIEYPQTVRSVRVGMVKLNVNQPAMKKG